MKSKVFLIILMCSLFIFSDSDFADSERISIHELQSKTYADSTKKQNDSEKKNILPIALIPIFAGAAYSVIYLTIRRKK